MDRELHAAVFEALSELDPQHNLPRSELRRIAEEAVLEGKVTDGEWQFQRLQESKREFMRKRNIARIRGYAPFSSLTQRVYTQLLRTFGQEVLELMKSGLADPEDIYSKWAYRFAATVSQIGLDVCRQNREVLYEFVTSHPIWEQNAAGNLERYKEWISQGSEPRPTAATAEGNAASSPDFSNSEFPGAQTHPEPSGAEGA